MFSLSYQSFSGIKQNACTCNFDDIVCKSIILNLFTHFIGQMISFLTWYVFVFTVMNGGGGRVSAKIQQLLNTLKVCLAFFCTPTIQDEFCLLFEQKSQFWPKVRNSDFALLCQHETLYIACNYTCKLAKNH